MTDPTTPEPAGTSTELVARPASTAIMTAEQFDSTWRMSKALAASGSFKDIGREDGSKALARIMLGADLGMSPTQALMGIDIVKGNPQIRGVALGRMVRNSARQPTPTGESYDYAVLNRGFEPGREFAIVALYRRDEDGRWPTVESEDGETFPTILGPITIRRGKRLPEAVEAFAVDQAIKRGLVKDAGGAWKDQPEVMVVWRALSQLVRFYAPDVIGGMPVYTEADSLRRDLGDGESTGEAPGWQGLSAEQAARGDAIVARARELGVAGLTSEGSLQMDVNGKAPHLIDAKLAEWEGQLASAAEATVADATEVVDAPVTEADPLVGDPEELDARALALMGRAEAASAEGDEDAAATFETEAAALHDEAQALRAGQTTLGGL